MALDQPGAADFPVGVLAAAILAAEGVSFILVGSAALWLGGEAVTVGDTDVVIEPLSALLQPGRYRDEPGASLGAAKLGR